ncbi:hypothetical protein COOONC_01610, partial [Cooperia oncophora]
MQPAGLLEESVVPLGAEETIVTSDVSTEETTQPRYAVPSRQVAGNGVSTDGPPVIPRYDNTGGSFGGRVASSRVLSPLTTTRMVQSASATSRSPVIVPTGAGKLLMVRRSDGTTQFLRQIPQPSDEPVSMSTSSVNSRIPQNIRAPPGSRVVQLPVRFPPFIYRGRASVEINLFPSFCGAVLFRTVFQSGEQDQSVHSRMVVSTEPSVMRTSYEQPADPFMKRMAVVEKSSSGPMSTPQRLIRHVPMQVELHGGEMYCDPVVKGDEQVMYSDQAVRVGVHPADRFQSSRFAHNSSVHRLPSRGSAPMIGASRMQTNTNSPRVYYVKNAVTVPSRVVLAPAPVESYVREEVVYDNDGYVVDGGEIPNHSGLGSSLPMRRITSYKEFCRRRGVNMRAPTRPYRFDFENNEDEERAIAEAIAREEELMRQEEADKGGRPEPGARDPAGRPYDEDPEEHARMVPSSHFGMGFYSQPAMPRYTSNLAIHRDDSPDTRAVKQVLETMVMQACRWDKQFGWYKNLLMKPTRPHFDRFKRRIFPNQRETVLAEHIDRLRKEINKRRTRMENKAEEMCGLPTPWRKSRMKSHMRGT